jgi:hypothetical protein
MARELLQLHPIFRKRSRVFATGLLGWSEARLFTTCSGCSRQGALNILSGIAKQSPENLTYCNVVGAFLGSRPDEVVIGVTLPSAPGEMLVSIINAVLNEVESPHVRAFLFAWRTDPTRTEMLKVLG